jgi:hypothetical protein
VHGGNVYVNHKKMQSADDASSKADSYILVDAKGDKQWPNDVEPPLTTVDENSELDVHHLGALAPVHGSNDEVAVPSAHCRHHSYDVPFLASLADAQLTLADTFDRTKSLNRSVAT